MAEGGVRTVQHLAERGVRLVFEVWPSRCPRVLRSPETATGRPKYTVLSGHVFIWSHYLQIAPPTSLLCDADVDVDVDVVEAHANRGEIS